MNFAQSILEKYGWSEGQGLGKEKSGISKPIKATFKFDNSGLGHDSAAEFNNHWWERVYNDAASNIQVSGEASSSRIETKDDSDDAVDISTSSINYKKLKKKKDAGNALKFGSFVKTATLTNLGREDIIENKVNLEEFRHDPVRGLTDEELFKACGGRTAHKGARHGLNLTGKLARLAQQDAALLKKMTGATSEPSSSKPKPLSEEEDELSDILYKAEYSRRLSKKKQKRKKNLEVELSNSLDSFSLQSPTREEEDIKFHRLNDNSVHIQKKKKSKKNKLKKQIVDLIKSKSKKRKNKKGSLSEDDIPKEEEVEQEELKSKSDDEVTVVKKKKKNKKSDKKESRKRDRSSLEVEKPYQKVKLLESETDTTELEEDSLEEECNLVKKRRCDEPMQPLRTKSKKKQHKKEVRNMSKSLSNAVSLDMDSGNEVD